VINNNLSGERKMIDKFIKKDTRIEREVSQSRGTIEAE